MLFTEVIKLLPGFRFRPTDEELVNYYLKRKVLGRLLPFEVIAEVDLYKYEPWDLPEKSALPTRDLEWYFFIPRDRKYPNGSRTNRATAKGYWKSTGKDRFVSSSSRVVGTKKTLVYYNGRAPKGERTNWVMHEYRLNDVECQRIHAVENGFVLCRVYQKSGLGPKNGEQYGAPVEDDEFDDSPTVEVDGCGFLKSELTVKGPSSPNTFLSKTFKAQGEDDCVSYGMDMAGYQLPCSEAEPRNLNVHFEKFHGDFQQNSMQKFVCSGPGDLVSTASGELVELVVPAPLTLDDEAEMLEQLLCECTKESKSTDDRQDNSMFVEDGSNQIEANLPSDGDFLELDDLTSLSDSGEGKLKDNEKNATTGFKEYTGEAQGSFMEVVPTFDAIEEWKNLLLADAPFEGKPVLSEVMESKSMSSSVSLDSQHQQFGKNVYGSFPPPLAGYADGIGPACLTQLIETEDENGLKMLNHLDPYISEKDILAGFLEFERNSELHVQEGGYFDAVQLFTDIEVCEESTNTNMEGCTDPEIPQVTLAQSQWVNSADECLDNRVLKAIDDDGKSQDQAACVEPGMRSPSSLSLFLRLMDSFPTLPASAAELSPKSTSPGDSIQVTATGIAMGSVSVTCTCIGEGTSSSCVKCSVTEVGKKGRFVKSMSFVGQRKKSFKKWDMGMLMSAVLGGILAVVIALLVAGGTWKVWEGVCKLIPSSKS